ncbi:hypothetical protein [Nitrosomonas sp. Nm34]|uniref:hypothetical protein n=1 Tax=Nitrosomonas sp. Nm34 TaxID=1881055 RepID=UPI0008DEFA62|nr:hypothetical protein [Nitrosomonas sp. Nm34]SFI31390.1 hypothetical protein SAMN05428978_100568 [Nitrosomonas sp. Nm34]
MAFEEDLSLFINEDTPGYTVATIQGQQVGGIFRNGYAEAGMIGTSNPSFLCITEQVSELITNHENGVANEIIIKGISYYAQEAEHSGDGLTRLHLRKL